MELPFSFINDERSLLIGALVAFILLFILVIVLLFYLKRISSMRKALYDKNNQLARLYDDLTLANNRLKKQYDELAAVQNSLDKSENLYEMLFNKMMNGFYIFEPIYNNWGKMVDFRFLKANPGFYRQIGLDLENVVGKTWQEVFGFPNQELNIYQSLLTTGKTERFETYNPKLGSFLVDAFLVSENQVGVVFENITEYKKAIKEAKTLNLELEKRVLERTRELQEAVKELESFSYTVSHDLKSPLRAVDGYASILLEDFGDQLGEDALQMLNNIIIICRNAIEMINKLLQYSRTARAKLVKEEINMAEKFNDVFNELKPAYPDRDISMIIETGLPKVFADGVLIRVLIQNILSNAFKFTDKRKKAVIRVGCTITDSEYVFYVKDNGVGFDMKYSGKLFSIFQRLHTSEEYEGNGIGLVTVKKIIEKHGGRVWIKGWIDAGAEIYFTIPLK